MVEQPEYGTNRFAPTHNRIPNRPYYVDIIKFSAKPYKAKTNQIKDLYLKGNLSAQQIADQMNVSKTFILSQLHKTGIYSKGKQTGAHPENYRKPNPPYGYKVQDGRLVLNKAELRVCRLIVQLRKLEELSILAITRELFQKNIKNRKGVVSWAPASVRRIYRRWKDKI